MWFPETVVISQSSLAVLSSLARINQVIDVGSSDLMRQALQADDAHLSHVDEDYVDKYQQALAQAKANKAKVGHPGSLSVGNV